MCSSYFSLEVITIVTKVVFNNQGYNHLIMESFRHQLMVSKFFLIPGSISFSVY